MNTYIIFQCQGYDESPNHEVLWAGQVEKHEAVRRLWDMPETQEWAEKYGVDWEHFQTKADQVDGTCVMQVYGTSLHVAPNH